MKILYNQKINKQIKEDFSYSFETNEGIYLVEITAGAKSWWQNFKSLRSLFKDDDITLSLDGIKIFTSSSKDADAKAIWNGNELKGLSKTVLIATMLRRGKHTLHLKPDQSPSVDNINIMELEKTDNNTIVYSPLDNNPPEKGDRRPWIQYVLQNIAIEELNISAIASKKGRDDEDIKLIIDGKVEENENQKSHKDWYWCGKILKGNEIIFKKKVHLKKGDHSVELWADRSPRLNKISITILSDDHTATVSQEEKIKPYEYKGIFGNEDYNRYDTAIAEVVSHWNNEFLKDTEPPNEPLDPNLVKAIIYQESRVGFDKASGVNVMQVGNEGDPSILTLRGELPEYWIHNGKIVPLKYDAEVTTVKDSINWGVRWLYHKAQGTTNNNKRYWISWKEAVVKYGPPKEDYVNSIWEIYTKGIKKEKSGIIRLWSIILFVVMILFSSRSEAYSLDVIIKDQIAKGHTQEIEGVEIQYSEDGKYFLAQIEWTKDWWEDFKVGSNTDKNINWLAMNQLPSEQSILSASFIDVKGFSYPLVEVYGSTHAGHGYLYIYEIENNALNLLFKTEAVDYNPDIRWAPENYKKYGYGNCGEIFSGGKLVSKYKDTNEDGNLDLIMSGTKEIVCETEYEYLKKIDEIKVGGIKIEKKFLWNKNKHTWINTANDS